MYTILASETRHACYIHISMTKIYFLNANTNLIKSTIEHVRHVSKYWGKRRDAVLIDYNISLQIII
jgi:hypothetical protein